MSHVSVTEESFMRPSPDSEEHIWELLTERTDRTRMNWVRVRLLTSPPWRARVITVVL